MVNFLVDPFPFSHYVEGDYELFHAVKANRVSRSAMTVAERVHFYHFLAPVEVCVVFAYIRYVYSTMCQCT